MTSSLKKFPPAIWALVIAFVPLSLFLRSPSALFDPLYWDSIMAVYNEVFWLMDHGLNLGRLASQTSGFSEGGANTYFFTWYPVAHAFVLSLLPEGVNGLAVLHLSTWLLAGGITALFVRFLSSFCSIGIALVGGLLLCFTPLFLSQCYLINMELWLLLFCLLGVLAMFAGRPIVCGAWLLLAFYTKASALTIVLPCVAFYTLVYVRDWRSAITACWVALPLGLYVVHGYISTHWINEFGGETYLVVENLFSIQSIWAMVRRGLALSFEQYIYLLLMAGATVGYVVLVTCQSWKSKSSIIVWRQRLADQSVGILCGMICASILLMTTVQSLYLPRYIVLTLPYPILWMLWATRNQSRLRGLFIGGWFALNLLNVNGTLYQKVSSAHLPNNGDTLERSLEYREELLLQQKLCELLEQKYPDHTIVSSWPILHELVEPRFGFVEKPFKVISSERKVLAWKGVQLLSDINPQSIDTEKLLWVSSDSAFFRATAYDSTTDELVEKVKHNNRVLWIYRKSL